MGQLWPCRAGQAGLGVLALSLSSLISPWDIWDFSLTCGDAQVTVTLGLEWRLVESLQNP